MHIPKSLAYFAGLACETVTWLMGTTTTLSRGSVQDACAIRYASGKKARDILGTRRALVSKKPSDYASRLGVKLPIPNGGSRQKQ
ncbi:3-beta hydroxysteroid dehydrogenase/isomerase [Penicillium expansum]|nr:3-beta hydroxysteroid dehydrogenase/isomerase [Penicillium expansum]